MCRIGETSGSRRPVIGRRASRRRAAPARWEDSPYGVALGATGPDDVGVAWGANVADEPGAMGEGESAATSPSNWERLTEGRAPVGSERGGVGPKLTSSPLDVLNSTMSTSAVLLVWSSYTNW